jgi:ribosomal protein S18 acetylase RimI-like enzyme
VTGFDVTARRATPDDLDSVLALDADIHMGHNVQSLLARRVLAGECWLAQDGARVVAYVTVRAQHFFGRDFVELLAVEPRVRRRGVGDRLLAHAIENSSTERVFTSTNRSNLAMIALLEKGRWRISGELEGIDEGDPELIYFIDRA